MVPSDFESVLRTGVTEAMEPTVHSKEAGGRPCRWIARYSLIFRRAAFDDEIDLVCLNDQLMEGRRYKVSGG